MRSFRAAFFINDGIFSLFYLFPTKGAVLT